MECVLCGGEAKKVVEIRKGRYRDEVIDVQSEFYRCESCRETFFTADQAEAHSRGVKNEIRKKYGLLPPEKIVAIRKKLDLSQAELEQLLVTGPKVVVRWESGKVIQSGSQDNILRLLEHDPSFLQELRRLHQVRVEEQKRYRPPLNRLLKESSLCTPRPSATKVAIK